MQTARTLQSARVVRSLPSARLPVCPHHAAPHVAHTAPSTQGGVSSRVGIVAAAKTGKTASKTASAPAAKGFGKVDVAPKNPSEGCPCGSMKFYKNCCEQYHKGDVLPEEAQSMLRARFSAYKKNEDRFLLATDQRPDMERETLKRSYVVSCEKYDYTGLQVLNVEAAEGSNSAVITFSYNSSKRTFDKRMNSRLNRMKAKVELNVDGTQIVYFNKERSTFEKLDTGLWVMIKSEVLEEPVNITAEDKSNAKVVPKAE